MPTVTVDMPKEDATSIFPLHEDTNVIAKSHLLQRVKEMHESAASTTTMDVMDAQAENVVRIIVVDSKIPNLKQSQENIELKYNCI